MANSLDGISTGLQLLLGSALMVLQLEQEILAGCFAHCRTCSWMLPLEGF